jgi:hypothetical protein
MGNFKFGDEITLTPSSDGEIRAVIISGNSSFVLRVKVAFKIIFNAGQLK